MKATVTIGNKTYSAELTELENVSSLPQAGSGYYLASDDGTVFDTTWKDDEVDHDRLAMGNVFRTEAEALAHANWLKAVATIRRSSDYKPVWDRETDNYCIYYSHLTQMLILGSEKYDQSYTVYYSTKAAAKAAIADPEIAKAYRVYFGVEK